MAGRKVLIIAFGTEGDTRPTVQLALSLQKQGYQVGVATHSNARTLVESVGATFFDVGIAMDKARSDTEAGKQLTNAGVCGKMSAAKAFLQPLVKQYSLESLKALKTFQPDAVLLSTLALWISFHAAINVMGGTRRIGIYHLMPFAKSREIYPCIGIARIHPVRVPCVCEFVWNMSAKVAWPLYQEPLKEVLEPEGISVDVSSADYLSDANQFYFYSPAFFPLRPSDWPSTIHVLGMLDALPEGKPEGALEAFAQPQDKDLVYFGMGSMLQGVLTDAEQLSVLRAFVNAAELAKVRAVIACPAGMISSDNPDILIAHGSLPHRWLFAKCKAVVTHGGAGTTHAALACGCPVVVLPCEDQSDQPFWGQAAIEAGVGISPADIRSIKDGRALGQQVADVVKNVSMKLKAEEVARAMAAEGASLKFALRFTETVVNAER